MAYRTGKNDVIHKGVRCDACNTLHLRKARYKCQKCYNYDLCSSCYIRGEHDLSHCFTRMDHPFSNGITMAPRSPSAHEIGRAHIGIRCDECGIMDIQGIRYKCTNCINYDLCSTCYNNMEHDVSHRFREITIPRSQGRLLPSRVATITHQILNDADTVHQRIRCDHCRTLDIEGVRYKCFNCIDYDLCSLCYNKGKHDLSHPFIKLVTPQSEGELLPARFTTVNVYKEKPTLVHQFIDCDACGYKNIKGPRFKCIDCENYDLCEKCYDGGKHDATHIFARINVPNTPGKVQPCRAQTMSIDQYVNQVLNHGQDQYPSASYTSAMANIRINRNPTAPHLEVPSLNTAHSNPSAPHLDLSLIQFTNTIHRGIRCDECGTSNIDGLRYKCNNCNDYDLCDSCYQMGKHELSHSFKIYDLPNSVGIDLEPRSESSVDKSDGSSLIGWKQNLSNTSRENVIMGLQNLSINPGKGINKPSNITMDCSNSQAILSENNPQAAGITPNRVKYLEKKVAELEEIHTCTICMEETRNVIFLCGHGSCTTCADNLQSCHMCRQPIKKKINVY